ncbi:hypothetical protein CEXT_66811 [Caerostris extrusa]|uniref:Uncharacterized protein n=1 Tax=Caerostris extrusa TaxID=172846 RepID=A0AAV4QIC4_CAEEX|nr:hypothetical protein CEXT_66811 [Caerostris extrusa]
MANRKTKMPDGRKTIVLVTDQEAGRQGVARDHHPLPVSERHVNPGASPVPCGQCSCSEEGNSLAVFMSRCH